MRPMWLILLLFLPGLAAAEPVAWAGTGTARYVLIHKFHEVKGTSTKVQARAAWEGDQVKVQARALVSSFGSEDANRDAHMQEVMEVDRFPFVTVRGVVSGLAAPAAAAKLEVTMKAEVELHGRVVARDLPLTLTFADATHVTVAFDFAESLEAHGIERPSLLFVKVDDALRLIGSASLERKP